MAISLVKPFRSYEHSDLVGESNSIFFPTPIIGEVSQNLLPREKSFSFIRVEGG